jgi:hypothetical protein
MVLHRDGTTSIILLIGELLKQAGRYLGEGSHPRVIVEVGGVGCVCVCVCVWGGWGWVGVGGLVGGWVGEVWGMGRGEGCVGGGGGGVEQLAGLQYPWKQAAAATAAATVAAAAVYQERQHIQQQRGQPLHTVSVTAGKREGRAAALRPPPKLTHRLCGLQWCEW